MPPPFDVHLTFLNFSQLHLVRNHWSRGCGLLSDSVLKICSLPVSKCLWGFPHSRVHQDHSRLIWERHLGRTHLITAIRMTNCSIVLVALPPRALPHIFSSCLKAPRISPPCLQVLNLLVPRRWLLCCVGRV